MPTVQQLTAAYAPPVPFGEKRAALETNSERFNAQLLARFPSITLLDTLRADRRDFYMKSSAVDLPGLHLFGFSHSPVTFGRSVNDVHRFILPYRGVYKYVNASSSMDCLPGREVFVDKSDNKRSIVSDATIGVCVTFDIQRLIRTWKAMTASEGGPEPAFFEGFSRFRLVDGKFSFVDLLTSLFGQVDALGGDASLLERAGLHDSLFRAMVLLFDRSRTLLMDDQRRMPEVRPEIRRLCEYMKANLAEPITLTEMERFSGLSARSLQYAFRKYFNCRPKEWLIGERLHAARARLQERNSKFSITALAYDLGFSSHSQFSAAYVRRFGETPSQTFRPN